MKKISKLIPLGLVLFPMMAMAAATKIDEIVDKIGEIFEAIIPVLMLVAFAVFLWGVVKFIFSGGDEEKRKSAKHLIVYGLIGLLVMIAVWGIIRVVLSTFGIQEGLDITIPMYPE